MIKKISIVLLLAIILLALIAAYFLIASIDDKTFDDLGLYAAFEDVDDEGNGFLHIAYTQEEKFKVYDSRSDATFVKHFLEQSEWDQAKVDQILKQSEGYLQDVIAALEKPYFRLPGLDDIYALPSYSPMLDLQRLLLLKAVDSYQQRDVQTAVEHLGYALAFSQAVQSESSHKLISFMIGQAMQGQAVERFSRIVDTEASMVIKDYNYSDNALKELQLLIEKVPQYSNDGFKEVFAGELRFQEGVLPTISQKDFSSRWNEFKGRYFSSVNDTKNASVSSSAALANDSGSANKIEFVSDAIHAVFPNFYMHHNAFLNESAVVLKHNANLASGFCNAIEPSKEGEPTNFRESGLPENMSWQDVFMPNSVSYREHVPASIYDVYFIRRCFTRTELEAVKATIAIALFEREKGGRPESLTELVPDFLAALPIDYFNGQPLGYSKEKSYLYSVGANFSDDGGSDDSIYHSSCHQDSNCADNPTFIINFSTAGS